MVTGIFALYAVLHIVLLIGGIRQYLASREGWIVVILLPILFLPYENIIIALGSAIGEGPALQALNMPRFLAHALLTPLWIIAAAALARRSGVRLMAGKVGVGAMCTLAVVLIGFSLWNDISVMHLVPEAWAGTLRYVNEGHRLPGPPVAAIGTIIVVIVLGAAVAIRGRWPWMLLGAVTMFLAAGAQASPLGLAAGAGGEIILATALLATSANVLNRQPAPAVEQAAASAR